MPGTEITDAAGLAGKKLIGRDGVDLGDIQEISTDRDRPEFALINTGLLGRKSTLVPLTGATVDDVRVWVDLDRESVKDAPTFDSGEQLSDAQREAIYGHYGIKRSDSAPQGENAEAAEDPSAGSAPHAQPQPSPDAEAGQPGTAAPPEQPAETEGARPAPAQGAPAASAPPSPEPDESPSGEAAQADDPTHPSDDSGHEAEAQNQQPDDPGPQAGDPGPDPGR